MVRGSWIIGLCLISALTWAGTVGERQLLVTDDGRSFRDPASKTLRPFRGYDVPAGALTTMGNCLVADPQPLVPNGPQVAAVTNCTDLDSDGFEFDVPWEFATLTVTLRAFSTGNNNTEVVAMAFAGQCVNSGGTPTAQATTGEQTATITWGNSAAREQSATTSAITLQGTCQVGSRVYLRGQIRQTPTTMAPMSDLRILGVSVQ